MRGLLENYTNNKGVEAVRIRFPTWVLPSGFVVRNVSIFPHECSLDVCEEGDHVHVDTYDSRPVTHVLREGIEFPLGTIEIIDRLLEAQLSLNKMTHSLAEHLEGSKR